MWRCLSIQEPMFVSQHTNEFLYSGLQAVDATAAGIKAMSRPGPKFENTSLTSLDADAPADQQARASSQKSTQLES